MAGTIILATGVGELETSLGLAPVAINPINSRYFVAYEAAANKPVGVFKTKAAFAAAVEVTPGHCQGRPGESITLHSEADASPTGFSTAREAALDFLAKTGHGAVHNWSTHASVEAFYIHPCNFSQ